MAFPDLTLPESLRPWTAQGLRLLLIQPVAETAAGTPPDEDIASDSTLVRSPCAPHASGPDATCASSNPTSLLSADPSPGAPSADPPESLPPAILAQWRNLLDRLPEFSRCVLTYHDLALDLAGRPDPVRRDFLRQLLTGLAQPRGTLTFWPLGLAEADGAGRVHYSSELFLEGLSKLQADMVFIFGNRCSATLGLVHEDYAHVLVDMSDRNTRMICFLPELEVFLNDQAATATLIEFILARLAS